MDIVVKLFDVNSYKNSSDKVYQINEIDKLYECDPFLSYIDEIVFLTSNSNKLRELERNLELPKHIKLTHMEADLTEIQHSDPLTIVQDKCLRAREKLDKSRIEKQRYAILIEDTSLNFRALGQLPGPYVKWFLKAIGPEGLARMLHGFEDKFAEAHCVYALMPILLDSSVGDNDKSRSQPSKIVFFRGVVSGRIVSPRGSLGWGWDPVFEESNSQLTFGEMDTSTKSNFSHRANAMTILKSYLANVSSLS